MPRSPPSGVDRRAELAGSRRQTGPKPGVLVIKPVSAQRCCISALVATVIPWPKQETSLACAPVWASASPTPPTTAREGSAGVEETFHTAIWPVLFEQADIGKGAAGIDADPQCHGSASAGGCVAGDIALTGGTGETMLAETPADSPPQ